MPRYYFHLTDDQGSVPDDEGMEFAGLWAAKHAAIASLQELLTDLTEFDDEVGEGRVDILDESGSFCASIQFGEVPLGPTDPGHSDEASRILRPFFGVRMSRTG